MAARTSTVTRDVRDSAITPDYFGENNNASNYGLIYSAKLASAIVGIGIGIGSASTTT
jgi:hypothetical protein